MVSEGVSSVTEMERHLTNYVKSELFAGKVAPERTNKRFFPSSVVVRNHMYRAVTRYRHSKMDQENLEKKLEEWKRDNQNDKFYFRGCKESNIPDQENLEEKVKIEHGRDGDDILTTDQQSNCANELLFVQQTEWQAELLKKYGNEISFLDATYKTSRYALPLFFVVVKTNVDYCVVASFVVQSESALAIKEALEVIKLWNPEWNPSYFMVDHCYAEINAIEAAFKGEIKLTSCKFNLI